MTHGTQQTNVSNEMLNFFFQKGAFKTHMLIHAEKKNIKREI